MNSNVIDITDRLKKKPEMEKKIESAKVLCERAQKQVWYWEHFKKQGQ